MVLACVLLGDAGSSQTSPDGCSEDVQRPARLCLSVSLLFSKTSRFTRMSNTRSRWTQEMTHSRRYSCERPTMMLRQMLRWETEWKDEQKKPS